MKAKLGRRHVRPWKWVPFVNPARTDGAILYHWRRVADEAKEYPFARFNKVRFHLFHIYLYLFGTMSNMQGKAILLKKRKKKHFCIYITFIVVSGITVPAELLDRLSGSV